MKKIMVLFLLVSLIGNSNAQIESGRKFIGSTIAFSGYHNTNANNSFFKSSEFTVHLNPRFGKFIRQNLAIGAILPLGYGREIYKTNTTTFYETLESKTNTFHYGAAFFVRVYKPITDKFYLHLEANIGSIHSLSYGKSTYTYATGAPTESKTEWGSLTSRIAVIPGLTYFAKPNLAFELNVGLLHFSNTLALSDPFSNLSTVQNTYGISFQSSTIAFGTNFFF